MQNYTDKPANCYIEDGKLVIKAIKECDPEGVVAGMESRSKKDLVAAAASVLKTPKGRGWLPPELRLATYAGPGAKKSKKR